MSLTNEFKRYENYSNVMMSIKKEISSLSLQLMQKDSSENKAQVRSNTGCVVFNQGRCLIINVSFSFISSYDEQGWSCRCCSQAFKSSIMLILVRSCKILALRLCWEWPLLSNRVLGCSLSNWLSCRHVFVVCVFTGHLAVTGILNVNDSQSQLN